MAKRPINRVLLALSVLALAALSLTGAVAAAPDVADARNAKVKTLTGKAAAKKAKKKKKAAAATRRQAKPVAVVRTLQSAAPTAVVVAGATQTTITVSWSAQTGPRISFDVFRGTTRVGSTTQRLYTVTGLECGSSYDVAVVRVSTAGWRSRPSGIVAATSPCADGTAPSAPAGLRQIERTATSATLAWDPSTDDTGVVGYRAYRDGVEMGLTAGTTYAFTGLTCDSTYEVAVQAFDASRNSALSTPFYVRTAECADTQPPTVPGSFGPQSVTTTTVTLRWNPSTDNRGVAGYELWRGSQSLGSVTSTSRTVNGLQCGTGVSFAVAAFDAAGNRSGQSSAVVSTAPCGGASDTTPPSAPGGLTVTGQTTTSIGVRWNASADDTGVSGYRLWLDGASVATTSDTNHTFASLTCGRDYVIEVQALDFAGNASNRAQASLTAQTSACPAPGGDTQAPTAPGSPRVTSATGSQIELAWDASTDDHGVAGYRVRRGTALLGTTAVNSYAVPGLACGTSYTFTVAAYDAAGNESAPVSVSGATSACADTTPPSTPARLDQTSRTETSIGISWPASTDNVGVAGYALLLDGTQVATVAGTGYTFQGLACGRGYSLSVIAYDAAGNRSTPAAALMSTANCVDTQPPTVPGGFGLNGTTDTTLAVRWSPATDNVGVAGYHLLLNGTRVGTTTSTTYTYGALRCNTSYALAVQAFDAAGNTSSASAATIAQATTAACPPPPPPGAGTTITVTDRQWLCDQPLSSYGPLPITVEHRVANSVSANGLPNGAVRLEDGCTGDGTQATDLILHIHGNGADQGTANDGLVLVRARDLQIEGFVNCGRPGGGAHQDGIQMNYADRITFRNFRSGNWATLDPTCHGAGGIFYQSQLNNTASLLNDVVCEGCRFVGVNQAWRADASTRSGARDSCFAARIPYATNGQAAQLINERNTFVDTDNTSTPPPGCN